MSSINYSKLLSQAGAILHHLSRAHDHRAQLAALESIEARTQLLKFGLLLLVVLLCGAFSVIMLSLIIAAAVWPLENRVQILGFITLGFGAATAIAVFILRHKINSWTPWAETRQQLREDCACFGELIKEVGPADES